MKRLRRTAWLVLAIATAGLDLWSKGIWEYPQAPGIDGSLHPTNRPVVESWLYFHAKWNQGGAWSMHVPGGILLWGTALAVPLIVAWIFWSRRAGAWENAAKALVLGGALGNLYDRWRWGMVRDWIDVCFGNVDGWHYPTFNVADIALVAGIAMLLLGGMRKRPAEAA
jgi:lipoprotein signal peptidase